MGKIWEKVKRHRFSAHRRRALAARLMIRAISDACEARREQPEVAASSFSLGCIRCYGPRRPTPRKCHPRNLRISLAMSRQDGKLFACPPTDDDEEKERGRKKKKKKSTFFCSLRISIREMPPREWKEK